jgi:hypothetical protein
VTDPWDRAVGVPGAPGPYANTHTTGSRYIQRWEDFVAEYEAAAINYSQVNLQILHSGGTQGRQPNRGETAPPPGYAQAYAAGGSARMPQGQAWQQPAARAFNETAPQAPAGETIVPSSPPGRLPVQPNNGFPPPSVKIFRSRNQVNGVNYDLLLMDGPVPPQSPPQVAQDLVPGEQVPVTDWPYIDGPGGRTQGGVVIDWSHGGGSVANVRVSPAQGQVRDDWRVSVYADIGPGPSTPTETKLKVTIRTTFSRNGQPDQVGISEVVLGGSGQHETTHREGTQAAETVAA